MPAMPVKTGSEATKPTAQQAGQPSGFGLSDIMSLLSPLYGMTQGKSPLAGGLLGMAIPGMGPIAEQQQGAPYMAGAYGGPGGMFGGGLGGLLQGLLGGGGLGSQVGNLGSLLAPQGGSSLHNMKIQDRLQPEQELAPKLQNRYMSPGS